MIARGHEVSGRERKYGFERAPASIDETILQGRDRQAGIVGVSGLKRAPADQLYGQGQMVICQGHGPEREAGQESRGGEAWQAVSGAARAVAGARRAEEFSGWNRP